MQRWKKYGVSAAGTALLWMGGCASPGVPRAPSLHLPAVVRDLSGIREGGSVTLRFTAPDETTDHQPLTHQGNPVPLTALVCRVQGAACLPVARLPVVPGQPVETVDTLPPPLTVGPGRAVGYRVRVINAAGRDAGLSREAVAAAGLAPAGVAGLTATTVAEGVQLRWQAELGGRAAMRVEATAEAAGASARPASGAAPVGAEKTFRLLEVPSGGRDPGGAVDAAPAVGARVSYRVYRVVQVVVGGQTVPLRGPSATVAAVRAADVFAPATPTGLLAVSFVTENAGPSVSLSWEPNAEADLAGYQVYRGVGAAAMVRVTTAPVAGVSFQDTGVRSGSEVRYAVAAVDRNGNESGRSAVVAVEVR